MLNCELYSSTTTTTLTNTISTSTPISFRMARITHVSQITASTDRNEVMDFIIFMSQGNTVDKATYIVEALPSGDVANYVIILSMASAMNVRRSLMKKGAKIMREATEIPPYMLVNGDINYSLLAMIGHVMFAFDDKYLSEKALKWKALYQTTIGGAQDITKFVSLPRDAYKARFLTKWKSRIEGFDSATILPVFKKKFPDYFKGGRSFSMMGPVTVAKSIVALPMSLLHIFYSVIILVICKVCYAVIVIISAVVVFAKSILALPMSVFHIFFSAIISAICKVCYAVIVVILAMFGFYIAYFSFYYPFSPLVASFPMAIDATFKAVRGMGPVFLGILVNTVPMAYSIMSFVWTSSLVVLSGSY